MGERRFCKPQVVGFDFHPGLGTTMPIEYERIRPPKRGRPFPYKCRRCGALATWKETFASRDRRRCRVAIERAFGGMIKRRG